MAVVGSLDLREEGGLQAPFEDQAARLQSKINRVISYWNKSSLLIPNVFRMAHTLDDDPAHLWEHQDLSKKELLVLNNGQKAKSIHDVLRNVNDSEEQSDTRQTAEAAGEETPRPKKRIQKSRSLRFQTLPQF